MTQGNQHHLILQRYISSRGRRKTSLVLSDRSALLLSEWKKKMRKTDFVREVYEENHSNATHRVGYNIFSRIFSIARSSLRQSSQMDIRDHDEKQKLDDIHEEHPWYGHRRIGLSLGWSMKKSRRLMKKFGISALMKKRRCFIKSGDQKQDDMHGKYIGWIRIMNHLKSLCPIHPHVVWRSDFTHIIYGWIHLYLATILDDFSKEIVGYALSYSHAKELILSAIQDAITKTEWIVPEYFHSDQWSEYTSEGVMQFLQMNHILISMSTKWSPWQNGAQESYYGKLKLELWDMKQYETREHLILAIHRQISYYNGRRLHTTIRDTPRWFREKHEEKFRILLAKNTNDKWFS